MQKKLHVQETEAERTWHVQRIKQYFSLAGMRTMVTKVVS